MKMKLWIVLPGHRPFQLCLTEPNEELTKEEFDDEVKYYREIISNAENLSIAIINEDGEKETLILWGEVLKNTYIRAQLK